MSRSRRKVGRLKVAFSRIEALAARQLADDAFAQAMGCRDWSLTKHSALYRCKDGSYTLCLIWHSGQGQTLTSTTRGIRLEVA